MNFINFLKQLDGKRRGVKRLVIYSIYLLAPLVIFATTFSSHQIMNKCEEVQRDYSSCMERLKSRGSGMSQADFDNEIRQLNRRISDLERENRSLRNTSRSSERGGLIIRDG